jgi:hypothetical protein
MKKYILGGIAALMIAAVAAWNVNVSINQKNELSLLELANVEALANNNEQGTGARSCSISWKVGALGFSVERSCSVTCDVGYNAKCAEKKCECVKA